MLKLIALVMLNGNNQYLNIRRKRKIHRVISSIGVILAFCHIKMPLYKYSKYTVFMLFLH